MHVRAVGQNLWNVHPPFLWVTWRGGRNEPRWWQLTCVFMNNLWLLTQLILFFQHDYLPNTVEHPTTEKCSIKQIICGQVSYLAKRGCV